MSARDDLIKNFRGSSETEKYRERSYIPGEAAAKATMHGLQGGIDGGVDDGPLQAPSWNRTEINKARLLFSQTEHLPQVLEVRFPRGKISDNAPLQGALGSLIHGASQKTTSTSSTVGIV